MIWNLVINFSVIPYKLKPKFDESNLFNWISARILC